MVPLRLKRQFHSCKITGQMFWGLTQNETCAGTLCFQEIRVPDIHPPIIDDRTFQQVVEAGFSGTTSSAK